jgi:class 3 adenylate cyclase
MALNLIRTLPCGRSSLAPCLSMGAMLLSIGLSLALPADLPPSLFTGLKLLGVLGMCSQASTVDNHLYTLFSRRHVALRLMIHCALPLVAIGLTLLGVYGVGLPMRSWGDSGTTLMIVTFGGIWLASAATGSLLVLLLNTVVRRISTSFRARIHLTVASIVTLASCLAYGASQHGPDLVRALAALGATPFGQDLGIGTMWIWDALQVLQPEESTVLVATTYFVGMVGLSVPAMVSTSSKLSDTMMKAVRPLEAGFEAVARGELDVRIPVDPTKDFSELTKTFNEMVESLQLAKRMERAFGSYVSVEIMEQIRTQHGRATLEPSLRVATVFFADIRGFTTMSERINPKQLLGVLNRFYESVAQVVEVHQGFLVQYIGDAVVVVFNGPIDQPAHATMAAACAIDIQKAVDQLNASKAFPEIGELELGIGIATGPMVAGNLGDSKHLLQYTVLGDTVNQAARMTGLVPAGAVWVNQRNADSPGHKVDPMPLASFKVKGRARPVEPHQVWPQLDATEVTEIGSKRDLLEQGT